MDIVILGAGAAGLFAATLLARAGHHVTVLERAASPGGRAATTDVDGYSLNLGPHALYTAGAAARLLTQLGLDVPGRDPGTAGHVLWQGAIHPLPASPLHFFTSPLFTWAGRMQAGRWLGSALIGDPSVLDARTVAEWVAPLTDPGTHAWALAMIRLFTYGNDPERQSAGAVARQIRRGLHGVRYLDGGWGALIRTLADAATAAGATIRTHAHVDALDGTRVRVNDAWIAADAVLVATPLPAARALLPELPDAPAVRAACLDLALAHAEPPAYRFILGIDRPLYASVHSETAKLAPTGGKVLHVAHYLAPGEHADVAELEALADRLVPGWRAHVVSRRFLPALTVTSGLSVAGQARPGVAVRPGVWVAGDWVGDEGLLVDASAASAAAAAAAIGTAGCRVVSAPPRHHASA